MKGHGWHAWTWAEMVRDMAAHVRERAPAGADVAAWWPATKVPPEADERR